MAEAGATFVRMPHTEPFGKVVVSIDLASNRWDLLGPCIDTPRADAELAGERPAARGQAP